MSLYDNILFSYNKADLCAITVQGRQIIGNREQMKEQTIAALETAAADEMSRKLTAHIQKIQADAAAAEQHRLEEQAAAAEKALQLQREEQSAAEAAAERQREIEAAAQKLQKQQLDAELELEQKRQEVERKKLEIEQQKLDMEEARLKEEQEQKEQVRLRRAAAAAPPPRPPHPSELAAHKNVLTYLRVYNNKNIDTKYDISSKININNINNEFDLTEINNTQKDIILIFYELQDKDKSEILKKILQYNSYDKEFENNFMHPNVIKTFDLPSNRRLLMINLDNANIIIDTKTKKTLRGEILQIINFICNKFYKDNEKKFPSRNNDHTKQIYNFMKKQEYDDEPNPNPINYDNYLLVAFGGYGFTKTDYAISTLIKISDYYQSKFLNTTQKNYTALTEAVETTPSTEAATVKRLTGSRHTRKNSRAAAAELTEDEGTYNIKQSANTDVGELATAVPPKQSRAPASVSVQKPSAWAEMPQEPENPKPKKIEKPKEPEISYFDDEPENAEIMED